MNGRDRFRRQRQRIIRHELRAIRVSRQPVFLLNDPRGLDRRREVAIVLEPDRGFEHDPVHPRGVGAGEAHRQHAAHRMGHDVRPGDLEMIEQLDCMGGQHVEAERESRLGRFPERDLVGHDHAVSRARERRDHRVPIARRKVAAMQQQHGAAVSGAGRLDVHIGHAQRVIVLGERQHRHRMRIGESPRAQCRTARSSARGRGRPTASARARAAIRRMASTPKFVRAKHVRGRSPHVIQPSTEHASHADAGSGSRVEDLRHGGSRSDRSPGAPGRQSLSGERSGQCVAAGRLRARDAPCQFAADAPGRHHRRAWQHAVGAPAQRERPQDGSGPWAKR